MGQIAQLVEHRTENPGVDGSIPSLPTTYNPSKTSRFYHPYLTNTAIQKSNVFPIASECVNFLQKHKYTV